MTPPEDSVLRDSESLYAYASNQVGEVWYDIREFGRTGDPSMAAVRKVHALARRSDLGRAAAGEVLGRLLNCGGNCRLGARRCWIPELGPMPQIRYDIGFSRRIRSLTPIADARRHHVGERVRITVWERFASSRGLTLRPEDSGGLARISVDLQSMSGDFIVSDDESEHSMWPPAVPQPDDVTLLQGLSQHVLDDWISDAATLVQCVSEGVPDPNLFEKWYRSPFDD